jgi:hypothetical protein
MNDLERRKKLLIAESEVCRELLRLELYNFRIYGIKARRKITSFGSGNPALIAGIPLLTSLLARKRRFRRLGAWGFIGWQVFSRAAGLFRRRRDPANGYRARTAAEEYLENRV